MKKLLIVVLTLFSLQSYATVMPNDSVAKQVQDSLNRSAWVLGWNEGVWIDSVAMPCGLSDKHKETMLSKSLDGWLKLVAEEDTRALGMIGMMYLHGVGAKQDEQFGLGFIKSAANKGRANSAFLVAFANVCGTGNLTVDYVEAIKWYKLAEELDKEDAFNFDLGSIYLKAAEQATTRKNYKKAIEIHEESLEYGNTDSAAYLVALYTSGLGVYRDIDKALEYAKQVDVKALFNNDDDYNKFGDKLSPETIVALIEMNTANLHQDVYDRSNKHHQARLLLSKAVEKDDLIGTYIAYKAAREVNDTKYAVYAIHKAADGGVPAAQYEVASSLVTANVQPEHSFKMFKNASENGYSKAYIEYGAELYKRGMHKEALKWISKATKYEASLSSGKGGKPYIGVASDKYLQSVELLAKLYLDGKGIEHNKDKALELLDELIKQVDGIIAMTKIQASPDIGWMRNIFDSKDGQIEYYTNQANSYISKSAELVKLKDKIRSNQ